MRTIKTLARVGAAVILSVLALATAPAQAQQWPQRTVKFIIPLGPGSGVDITARMVADRLSKIWNQSVVVENRPGGDGMVAITAFLGARDDHVLFFSPSGSFTSHPYLHDKLPYDPRDLSPVARVSSTLVAFGVPASLNVKTLADLIAMARAEPGKLNWASATGTNDFLFSGYLKQAGLSMAKVPYRDTVQALNDLAEGRIQFYVGAMAIMRSQVQAGKVKFLAVTNRVRAAAFPEVPTAAEAGYPDLGFDGLVGLFGPRDMPEAVRERIATDIKSVVSDPEVVTRLTATGQVVIPGTYAEFAKDMDSQRAQVAAVGQTLGIKPAGQ
jgi:tripartite-type tricarboxylate transporter receptor subunit TctC